MLDRLTIKYEAREKKGFHCSDFGKSNLDLFLSLKNITRTNPPKWYDYLRMGAGNGAEVFMLKALVDSGIVDESYDQNFDGRVEFKIGKDIPVTGYMDAVTKTGYPIEIKTINNANKWDILKYEQNKPRESYVGQLASYMHFLGKDTGFLFVSSIDGLNRFWFECKHLGGGLYKCGETVVNLAEEFKRWEEVWNTTQAWKYGGVGAQRVPFEYLNQYQYKVPVEKIDWTTISAGDISKARMGHKVIGDWQVLYSDWKDLIVKLQGSELGYSEAELKVIKDLTSGYTTWSKK